MSIFVKMVIKLEVYYSSNIYDYKTSQLVIITCSRYELCNHKYCLKNIETDNNDDRYDIILYN